MIGMFEGSNNSIAQILSVLGGLPQVLIGYWQNCRHAAILTFERNSLRSRARTRRGLMPCSLREQPPNMGLMQFSTIILLMENCIKPLRVMYHTAQQFRQRWGDNKMFFII